MQPNNEKGSRGKVGDHIIFSARLRLIFNTSFTGQDLLRIRFQAGNIPNFREATGTNMARLSFDSDTGNQLILNQLYYQFSIGSAVKVSAIAQGTLFDVVDTINPLLGSDSRGSISAFGIRSPIYREETGGTHLCDHAAPNTIISQMAVSHSLKCCLMCEVNYLQ